MSALEAIMAETEDLELFPEAVVQLYKQHPDGPARARKALQKYMRNERDPRRASLQEQFLGDSRLWAVPCRAPTLYTLNGIGTMLVGAHEESESDGSYISTQWLCLIYVPIIPLASFWVSQTDDGYYFLGKVHHPLAVRRTVAAVVAVIGVVLAAIGGAIWWTGQSAELVLYNGFERSIVVSVDDQEVVLGSGEDLALMVPVATTSLAASFPDEPPFEVIELVLQGRGTNVYNAAGRGLLFLDYIVYGDAEPPESELVGEVLSHHGDVDYVFYDPPESKDVPVGKTLINSVLGAHEQDLEPSMAIRALIEMQEIDAAVRFAEAGLVEGRSNLDFLQLAVFARSLSIGDGEMDLVQWCDALIEQYPDSVDRHRFCQQMLVGDHEAAVIDRYQALAVANPKSAMHQYLAGRLLPGPDAVAWYTKALAVDPDYAYAHMAIGYRELVNYGDFQVGLDHTLKAVEANPELAAGVFDQRLRLSQLVGTSREQLLEAAATADPSVYAMADMLELQGNPDLHLAQQQRIRQEPIEWDAGTLANIEGNISLIAGRVDELRAACGMGAGLELFLALSDGADEADRAWAAPEVDLAPNSAILAWYHTRSQGRDSSFFAQMLREQGEGDLLDALSASEIRPAVVQAALMDASPEYHAPAWFIAFRETGDMDLARRARAWATPPQLPWFEG